VAAKKRNPIPVSGLKAEVAVERNGAFIKILDVPAEQAPEALEWLIKKIRSKQKQVPELIQQLEPCASDGAICFDEGDDEFPDEVRKRIGFTT
jgi:hypothetical protein